MVCLACAVHFVKYTLIEKNVAPNIWVSIPQVGDLPTACTFIEKLTPFAWIG